MSLRSLPASAAAALTALAAGPAEADHYLATADPQVVRATEEMAYVYGGLCQQGDPQACQSLQYIQGRGGAVLSAGHDCQA